MALQQLYAPPKRVRNLQKINEKEVAQADNLFFFHTEQRHIEGAKGGLQISTVLLLGDYSVAERYDTRFGTQHRDKRGCVDVI